MQKVYIIRASKFLPNEAIENENIEAVLGMVNSKPSKAKNIVLRNNGIKQRYYAFSDGSFTHTNAELTALAIKELFADSPVEMDVLTCGTSFPDQLLPSHASMTLGLLSTKPTETHSLSGACCTSIQGLKTAFLAVATGEAKTAVSTGSERLSAMMEAKKFDGEFQKEEAIDSNGYLAFEKDFLRYMLSDGASAVLLSDTPNKDGLSLSIDWIELTSFSNELETCMFAGCERSETGEIISWKDATEQDWLAKSIFSVKQDTKLLGQHIVEKGIDFLEDIIKKRSLDFSTYQHFLPHLSSEFFRNEIQKGLIARGLSLPPEIWFTNLHKVGNVGSASPFLMIEELMNENHLKKGEKILMMIPESARFSYAYLQLTVV